MNGEVSIVSTFESEEDCGRGIEALHRANVHDFRAFAPYPSEDLIDAINEARGLGRSFVRWWVLLGGITGFLTAIAVTVGTSYEWNLNVGGRPVASIPPYIVIMFELTILFGGVAGVIGFFLHSRLPAFGSQAGYRPRFNADKFGVVVQCGENDANRLESLLRNAGAEEVQREVPQTAALIGHGH
jgi:hypothetical protein